MRRIADRFVLGAPLGTGGMGSLYVARDERLGEEVAVKLLKRSLLEDPVLRERFRREAQSLAKLRHPGIVTVYDAGEADGDLYTVLELVRGETLEDAFASSGAMTIERAAPVVDQILAALEVCHASEIVHRDIKPSNVMLAGERVVLIDFGLARVAGGGGASAKLTETGAVQGTPHYMAPEQCRGEEVGPAGDVYSAGVVIYEMLSGAQPFKGSDAATLMAQHMFVEPAALRAAAPQLSAGVAAAVHAALAKQPEDRPTARELREAFAAAVKGVDPEARAETAAVLRRAVAGLSRSERAIGNAGSQPANDARKMAEGARVVVWTSAGERSAGLLACIATAGLACSSTEELPIDAGGPVVIVVSARDGMDRVRELRAVAPGASVLVVDVAGPEETTQAIRAGANDMLLREAPDADVVPKLERLLRRRGRG